MHHLTFYGFMLCFAATSGLALWAARGTAGLPLLLFLQLGAVMALFATMPYGKFAHGIFRTASLLRHAVEKKASAQSHRFERRLSQRSTHHPR